MIFQQRKKIQFGVGLDLESNYSLKIPKDTEMSMYYTVKEPDP